MRLKSVHLGGLDQAHNVGTALAAAQRAGHAPWHTAGDKLDGYPETPSQEVEVPTVVSRMRRKCSCTVPDC